MTRKGGAVLVSGQRCRGVESILAIQIYFCIIIFLEKDGTIVLILQYANKMRRMLLFVSQWCNTQIVVKDLAVLLGIGECHSELGARFQAVH